MAADNVNRNEYIVVQGWMVTDLGLRGNELLVFSYIHTKLNYSTSLTVSINLKSLSVWLSNKEDAEKCLFSLAKKGYISICVHDLYTYNCSLGTLKR